MNPSRRIYAVEEAVKGRWQVLAFYSRAADAWAMVNRRRMSYTQTRFQIRRYVRVPGSHQVARESGRLSDG